MIRHGSQGQFGGWSRAAAAAWASAADERNGIMRMLRIIWGVHNLSQVLEEVKKANSS
jgi:hypothetical protein